MTELELDTSAARETLQAMIRETDEQRDRHLAQTPEYPAAAAGARFAGQGAALAEMLAQVHGVGTRRIDALLATAAAAAQQVGVFAGAERDFADALEPRS